VEAYFFFGGVGVEFTSYPFERVQDVKSTSLLGTFKSHVLPEMRQSLLLGPLVTATNIEHNTTMRYLGVGYGFVSYSDSVRESINLVFFHSVFLNASPAVVQ
jgi:hypothetical protein